VCKAVVSWWQRLRRAIGGAILKMQRFQNCHFYDAVKTIEEQFQIE
jgi:hypothetical protein